MPRVACPPPTVGAPGELVLELAPGRLQAGESAALVCVNERGAERVVGPPLALVYMPEPAGPLLLAAGILLLAALKCTRRPADTANREET